MKIGVGSDHRGLEAKQKIVTLLASLGHEVTDYGNNETGSSDYPDSAYPAAKATASGEVDHAILLCGNGIGMSIVANKVRGVRAALCHDELSAEMSRAHNNSNVLCLASDLTTEAQIRRILDVYLNTTFEGGRHERRINKINDVEREQNDGRVGG
jgi:ribose 5-phosphate isomerase B